MATGVRQQMIEATTLLLAKKGLQGASFSAILEASGAPRGSLYHHFPAGKDELVLAAVETAGARALAVIDGESGASAQTVAATFVGLWRALLTRSDFTAGCAVAAVTVAADSDELLRSAGAVFRGWRTALAAALAAGGVPADRAPGLAASLIASCEGAVVLARAEGAIDVFDLVAAEQVAAVREAGAGRD